MRNAIFNWVKFTAGIPLWLFSISIMITMVFGEKNLNFIQILGIILGFIIGTFVLWRFITVFFSGIAIFILYCLGRDIK